MTPKKALAAYLLTASVFLLGIFSLYHNLEPQLDEAENAINHGLALVLEKGIDKDKLAEKLSTGGYFDDTKDAALVASRIKEYLEVNGSLTNLGSLLKPELKIPADYALSEGGPGFKLRVENDLYKLGNSPEFDSIAARTANAAIFEEPGANGIIRVQIKNKKGADHSLSNIPVRIKRYDYKKTYSYTKTKGTNGEPVRIDSTLVEEILADSILGCAKTDENGIATFKVKKGGYYSVLPIHRGFQYGREKGTTNGALSDDLKISFVQEPHVLTLLSPQALSNIKYDRSLLVRTPAEFKDSLIRMAVSFILGWGVFLLFILQLDKKSGTRSDYLLIIALMILSGIGLLTSFGIWNPLTDTLYGSVMSNGLLIGLLVMGAISLVNYARLDARLSSSKWRILRNYGWIALAGAFGLLCLLYLFGTGPEGSDAKVNLFGFQPSEISRVLIVIFMAWFFARKATLIQDFSQRLTKQTITRQIATISWIILGIMVLMMVYLVLSDMGPALVVLTSFILIYSMARRDFAQLLLGLVSFIALMLGARWLNNSLSTLLLAAAVWFIVWFGYWYWKNRQIYESAIFLNLVIVVFSLAGPILESVGQYGLAARLTTRTDMSWEGIWNNEVLGGDQVVQGIWSLATGGFKGLGLGNGSPAIVPAGHTDMIFTSIGEMLGLAGLILVVLCFFVVIHRTLLIGRRAGYAFPFYLATGLGIVTGIQFLVIVAGSIGLLPLTGVTLPFLSYGRVSLIVSLASFGFVISISRLRANEIQREYTNSFNGSIAACSGLFLLIGVIILGTAAKYQILSRGETLIRPAYVTNMEGARIIEYNPRIELILRKLEAGNIYDREGRLLATSSRKALEKEKNVLNNAGVTDNMYKNEFNQHKRRYYPFGDHMLFMLGDYNTQKVFNYYDYNPTGYLAEARHFSKLRGIDIPVHPIKLLAHSYKENRFVDAVQREFDAHEYDYSNLLKAGFLDYGIERNPIIEEHNSRRQTRDIKMTIDAKLQTHLQNKMWDMIGNPHQTGDLHELLSKNKGLRASVVVIDAQLGDVLCSANYPLPNQDSILSMSKFPREVPFERIPGHTPETERDLGLTFQTAPGSTAKIMTAMGAFRKLGVKAFDQGYDIKTFMNIEEPNKEPNVTTRDYNRNHGRTTYMENAITYSSNCYFIMLLNDQDLYPELGNVYWQVGANIDGIKSLPFNIAEETSEWGRKQKENLDGVISQFQEKGLYDYGTYMATKGKLPQSTDWKKGKNRKDDNRMSCIQDYTGIAWGQSRLSASPLNMARVAGIVANDGVLSSSRFLMDDACINTQILNVDENELLNQAMKSEASRRKLPASYGGKTGTPMRERKISEKKEYINDAWYIFFIESTQYGRPIAVAVRLERIENSNSGLALQFTKSVVIEALKDCNYIK